MTADKLLSCLDFVKQTGKGKWIARCAAHDDKSPSLSITEKDDGRVLIHCHAGCGAAEVLDAVGLDYTALYPEDLTQHYHAPRRVSESEQDEVDRLTIEIARADRMAGKKQSRKDREAERAAFTRLRRRGKPIEKQEVPDIVAEIAWEGWLRGRAQG